MPLVGLKLVTLYYIWPVKPNMLLASEAHVLQQIVFSPNQDSQNATQILMVIRVPSALFKCKYMKRKKGSSVNSSLVPDIYVTPINPDRNAQPTYRW
ncbi:Structural maintenance of chromosomes protein 6 [Fusarium oxysporum f. sp. albedinis]|nr:Structural maintenance of chromosomes protein 6 [Fusarium oxysporum f. sp. albedinis]